MNSYVKDLEEYFLALSGAGLMLSPEDYDLIRRWKKRGIPKEAALKAIDSAFRASEGSSKPRKLKHIAPFIEEQAEISEILNREDLDSDFSTERYINKILFALDRVIREETREALVSHYAKARDRVSSLLASATSDDGVFDCLREIQGDFFEDFFRLLPPSEAELVAQIAEAQISRRARFMTERALAESLIYFRNEALSERYGLKPIAARDDADDG
ncbi:MAG: hypothetical protein ACT4NX_02680 [Deltaproteobacteria bacterium]